MMLATKVLYLLDAVYCSFRLLATSTPSLTLTVTHTHFAPLHCQSRIPSVSPDGCCCCDSCHGNHWCGRESSCCATVMIAGFISASHRACTCVCVCVLASDVTKYTLVGFGLLQIRPSTAHLLLLLYSADDRHTQLGFGQIVQ